MAFFVLGSCCRRTSNRLAEALVVLGVYQFVSRALWDEELTR